MTGQGVGQILLSLVRTVVLMLVPDAEGLAH